MVVRIMDGCLFWVLFEKVCFRLLGILILKSEINVGVNFSKFLEIFFYGSIYIELKVVMVGIWVVGIFKGLLNDRKFLDFMLFW